MSLWRGLLRHIIVAWGVLVFLSGMAVVHLDLQYDAGGLESLVFLFFLLLGQPAFVAGWLIEALGITASEFAMRNAALVLGLVLCVAADLGVQALLRQARSARGPH
jgi:hypothetical protein